MAPRSTSSCTVAPTDGFLSGVYQDVLNRALDASGAQSWVRSWLVVPAAETVAAAILTSLEAETDEAQSDFSQFLHRSADPAGLNGFTTALQQGVPNEVVIAAIVGSDEYFSQRRLSKPIRCQESASLGVSASDS